MQHIQPLYNSQKHFVLKWQEDKDKALGRKSLWDDLMKQEKKDKKQAPNAYFKSEKKSDLLRTDRMVQSLIMSEKRTFGRISKSPKISQIDELMKEADGKNEGKVDIEELCQRLCPAQK